MRTRARWSSWSICPSMRGDCCSRVCSLTALASGLITRSCCACAGAAKATSPANAIMPRMQRARAHGPIMARSPASFRRRACPVLCARCSYCDPLAIGGHPAPRARAVSALDHAFLVDLGDDLAVTGQQRLGRTHLRAQRQLALEQAVGAILGIFLAAPGNFRPPAARAIGALVHLAARAEVADLGILRGAERTGVEAVAAADAEILRMQHDAVIGREDAGYGADRGARRVGA